MSGNSMIRSKKGKKYIFATIGVFLVVFIIGAYFISSKLPEQLNLFDFAEGIIETEVKQKPFAEVVPNVYFHKDGSVEKVIDYLAENGISFIEQFGSTYKFSTQSEELTGSAVSITRWHKILILRND